VLLVPIAWFLGPAVAVSFVWGSLLSFLAVALGVEGACCAASRAAQAAREAGGPRARNTAYTGGAVSGLAVASLGLLGVGAAHVALSSPSSAADLAGFVLGASCVALVSRGGGLLSKASDRGADLLARLGELPGGTGGSDPVKTLALSAEIAADTAGAGADLFDSVAGALVAAVVVASAGLSLPAVPRPALAAFPLLLAGAGLLASIAGGLAVAGVPAFSGARTARLLSALPALVLAFASFGLAALLRLPVSLGAAAAVGGAVSPALGAATRYYASRKPVARLAESSQLGAAANVLAGLAAGLEGGVVPALLLGAALFAASSTAGLVGATLCAVGMASCAGLAGSLAAFAPIASQAHGIAAGSGLGGDARETTESLQAEGVAQSARGRGFAAGAAALAAVALFCGYVALAGVQAIDLNHPKILVGLLVGAALPFLVSAMALNGVGDVALELVAQLRRILREEGAQAGSAAWVRKWVSEASRFAAGRTVVPSLMALGVPVAVGFGLGAEALGGVLAGAIVSGTLLSFALADAGDVWRGGRRWIEAGAMGGEGSEAHRAALVGDAVGEPLKDAAGPAVQVFIKAMAAVSLVIAPILPHV
jgi:K(+)-stimulated pyrophosphate-energized sodium pump